MRTSRRQGNSLEEQHQSGPSVPRGLQPAEQQLQNEGMRCEQPSDCPRGAINRSLVGGAILYFVEKRVDIAARRSRKQ